MRLLLIRHGQTPDNVIGALGTTTPGARLTDLGLRQAEALPAALAGEEIGALFVSTLVRTQLTAAPLAAARGLEPVVLADLREVEAGDLELRSDPEAGAAYMGTVARWVVGDHDARMPGAETGHEFLARYDRAIARATAGGHETVAVVSHGAAVRGWAGCRVAGAGGTFVRDHALANTGVVVVEGTVADGFRLVSWEGAPVGGAELVDRSADDPTGGAPAATAAPTGVAGHR
jgi:broad specificity phosphatase PhoE